MTVVTRFAPSPTGFLHIGGARTALFSWLYAQHCGGKMLLRIEDTDRQRSTDAAIDAILDGMNWLGLTNQDEIYYQFSRQERHAEVAAQLIKEGKAYYCYASPEELDEMREKQRAAGQTIRYDGRWRDRDASEAPEGIKPVVRIKSEQTGQTVVKDLVQGDVTVENSQLDDFVILRSDGTPTYMLAVVVDDHDMAVTHVIRGDDHLTNTFRQIQIYKAMGWNIPEFAHVPLINGPDGAKLSKRHGALGVDAYRDMGYLPEAILNYLMRLSWSHGDDEIISIKQAIEWFDIKDVGKAAARFDFAKLDSLNAHYIREADDDRLADLIKSNIAEKIGSDLTEDQLALLIKALPSLKERAKTLLELADAAAFYFMPRPLSYNEKAVKLLNDAGKEALAGLIPHFDKIDHWTEENLNNAVKEYGLEADLKMGKICQPLRAALTGSNSSPSIFEVVELLGKDEALARIQDALK